MTRARAPGYLHFVRPGDAVADPATRRMLLAALAGGAFASHVGRARAQAPDPAPGIPSAPVKLVVGYATGTSPDIAARTVAKKLEETWTAGVVVENRPGAGGGLAVGSVLAAPPDGLTFFWGTTGEMATGPALNRKLPYDPGKLVPIMELITGDMSLSIGAQTPARTPQEFLRWAADRKPLLIGTFGPGSPHHILALLFGAAASLPIEAVHYKSVQDILGDLSNGNIHAAFGSVLVVRSWQQTGRVRALGVVGAERSPLLPDAPSFREAGLDRVTLPSWSALFGPPGLPEPLAARAYNAFDAVLRNPEMRVRFEELGYRTFDTRYGTFAKRSREDRERMAQIVDMFKLAQN